VVDLRGVQEDHPEEAVDHQEEVPAPATDTPEEINWWEIPPRYLMENARGHNCSSPNGRSIGVSTIRPI